MIAMIIADSSKSGRKKIVTLALELWAQLLQWDLLNNN
jgi:hypothetical protein